MENSAGILFEDKVQHWYIAMGNQWLGPLTAAEVYQKVINQEISWAHFVWKPGQTEWRRICDVKTFQTVVPPLPQKSMQKEVKVASAPVVRTATKRSNPPANPRPAPPSQKTEERIWFIFHNESQYGPFTFSEIDQALRGGKVHLQAYIWRDGLEDWKWIQDVEDFRESVEMVRALQRSKAPPEFKSNKPTQRTSSDQRLAPRRPLVAKIMLAAGEQVSAGVCRDISVGGMQVLIDRCPGKVGTRVKLNVSAAGQIAPFVAEGMIVRILEDYRGFSFRFDRLSDLAKKSIEDYIHASGI